MPSLVHNQVGRIRKSRGIGATELARRVKVSRQTIYAIEAGTYVPNTEVALRLACELEVTVDDLFSLPGAAGKTPDTVTAEVLSAGGAAAGQAVRLCQVGSQWVSVPVSASPYYLPEADGVLRGDAVRTGVARKAGRGNSRADVMVFGGEETSHKRLVLAGCDPATSLLAQMVERDSGVEVVPAAASSKLALEWLKQGKVHVAGTHLEDSKTGEFNLPYVRREFPGEDFSVITFARWEEGLVAAAGNPKEIRGIEDLARKNVRLVNRDAGSGSRALLDKLLAASGVAAAKINGYTRVAQGHLAAAYTVLTGEADCCLATRSAARTFGLDFLPLSSERYDLVMRRRTLELPAATAFLDILQRSALRRKLEVLAGYDTSQTGAILA